MRNLGMSAILPPGTCPKTHFWLEKTYLAGNKFSIMESNKGAAAVFVIFMYVELCNQLWQSDNMKTWLDPRLHLAQQFIYIFHLSPGSVQQQLVQVQIVEGDAQTFPPNSCFTHRWAVSILGSKVTALISALGSSFQCLQCSMQMPLSAGC